MRKEVDKHCTVPGCCEPLTSLTGPGSKRFCAQHQLNMSVYGGTAKEGRIHTQHKEKVCTKCGLAPWSDEVAKKYGYYQYKYDDPDMFNRCARAMLVGDHSGELRKVDGNKEHKEDIDTLCQLCNSVKTQVNNDCRKRSIV